MPFTGDSGDNLFVLETGIFRDETFDGSAGADVFNAVLTSVGHTFNLSASTISNGFETAEILNFETVIAGSGDDVLIGGIQAQPSGLFGGAGNDTVMSGPQGISDGDQYEGGVGIDVLSTTAADGTIDQIIDLAAGIWAQGARTATIAGFEHVIASGDDDVIRASTHGQESLEAGLGDDTIVIGPDGPAGGEVFDGGAGTDLLDFSNQDTTGYLLDMDAGLFHTFDGSIIARVQNFERVIAGAGNDFVIRNTAMGAAHTLDGGAGNDTITFGATGPIAGDVFIGGAGTDLLNLSDVRASSAVTIDVGAGTFFATEQPARGTVTFTGFERIYTTLGDDSIIAGRVEGPALMLSGGEGQDTVVSRVGGLVQGDDYDGSYGVDTFDFASDRTGYRLNMDTGLFQTAEGSVTGTAQNFEVIFAGEGADVVAGTSFGNTMFGGGGADQLLGRNGQDYLLGDAGNDLLRGGEDSDTLNGGTGNDRLFGDAGDDLLQGAAGNDTLVGGTGNDTQHGGNGVDALAGNTGNDVINGDGGNDRLWGEGGFDTLNGGAGRDRLDGGAQADNLLGGTGNDTLIGGAGFDRLFGGDGDDLGYGGTENDALFGQNGNDTLIGQAGDDLMNGGFGNDLLGGGTGDDGLFGGGGFDTLIGGSGNDLLQGNFNADLFIFADADGGFGRDMISDFDATNDLERIDLSRVASITDIFDLLNNHATQIGTHVLINAGGGNTINLQDVALSELDSADFIF